MRHKKVLRSDDQLSLPNYLGHYLVITLQKISPVFLAFPWFPLNEKNGITTRIFTFFRYPVLSLVVPDRAFRV